MQYKSTSDLLFVGIIYQRYSHLVLGLSLKYLKDKDEAKDAVMQIFEKLIVDLKKYDIEYFKSWLYTFSKNHCLQIIRKKQMVLKKEIDMYDNASSFMETEADLNLNTYHAKEEKLVLLEKALESLNPEQKTCIDLFYLKNKSYTEIETLTGYTQNEVKSFIQNGKRNLKIKIEKSEQPE